MEPPAKRPRVGAAPFEEDDPDEDELVSRPEEVNARRDPGLRFERSRALAAFKLKSAFESIFEKYGKDFTGVGDEIDLRTGEIIVNNGHIQSLKNAAETQQDDDEDEVEDTNSGSTPLNEESSGQDNQQDSLGYQEQPDSSVTLPELPSNFPQQLQPPPPPPPPPYATTSSFHGEGWAGTPAMMENPLMFPHTMFPGQMSHGAFSMYLPMPYSGPIPMPVADPAWQTPELNLQMQHGTANSLPMPDPTWQFPELPASAFDPKEPHVAPTRKKARQLVTIVREDSSDVEGDILGKGTPNSNQEQTQENPEEALIKKKVLLPRPVSEETPVKKKKGRAFSKQSQDVAALPKKPTEEEESATRSPRRRRPRLEKSTSTRSGFEKSVAKPIAKSQADSHEPLLVELTPSALNNRVTRNSSLAGAQKTEDSSTRSTRKTRSLPIRQQQLSEATPAPAGYHEAVDAEVYIDLSNPETKLARKPQNQSLRVEIVSKKSIDIASFRAITPEAIEIASDSAELAKGNGESTEMAVQNSNMRKSSAERELAIEGEKSAHPSPPLEVFSRNTIDVDYSFSDEDEPLPQRRQPRKVPVEAEKALNASQMDVDAMAESIPLGPPALEKNRPAETLPSIEEVAPLLAECVHQEFATVPAPGAESQRGPKELPTTPEMSSPKVSLPSRAANTTEMVRTKSASRRLATAPRLEIPDSDPMGDPSTQESLSQPRRAPSPSFSSQGDHELAVEVSKSDALVSPNESIVQDDTAFHHTQPSPTLSCTGVQSTTPTPKADPASAVVSSPSKPADKSSRSSKKAFPSTPIKTPPSLTNGKPLSHQGSSAKPPATTATNTSAKRKNNILSLLSDSEDELSIMSPATQKTPATTRSSPASHHVRLFSSFPIPVSSALKRDALMNSAGKAAVTRMRTPDTVSKSGRKSKVISGSAAGRRSGSTLSMNTIYSTPSKPAGGGGGLGDDLVVQTPGGTVRRCGEDGFRCERDFCFGCL